MSTRHRGYVPSIPADLARFKHVRHLFGAAVMAETLAASATTSQNSPPVMDQGQTSSCGGHGTSCGVATTAACKGKPLPFVPSPKGIYDDARECAAPSGTALTDSGIDPATLLTSLAKNGVRAIQAPTPDGRYSDCDPATINVPETSAQDESAQVDLLVGEYAIDPRATDFDANVATCLSNGVTVGAGIATPVDTFEAWGENYTTGKLPLAGTADFNQADHWIVVVDYRTATATEVAALAALGDTSTRIYKIRNSWGAEWGCPDESPDSKGGCIEVTSQWLQSACAESIAFDVSQQAAA